MSAATWSRRSRRLRKRQGLGALAVGHRRTAGFVVLALASPRPLSRPRRRSARRSASTAEASTLEGLLGTPRKLGPAPRRVEVERVHVEERSPRSTFTVARSRPSERWLRRARGTRCPSRREHELAVLARDGPLVLPLRERQAAGSAAELAARACGSASSRILAEGLGGVAVARDEEIVRRP